MKRVGQKAMALFGGFVLATTAQAAVNEEAPGSGNPYSVIVERNVFDLREPPPPPTTQPTNTPPPNVKLTGLTTILGKKQALFLVQEPAQPGKPPNKEESFILAEGQRQGVIEVVEIVMNLKSPSVKIKNDGVVSVLNIETPKLPVAAAVPPPGPGGPAGTTGRINMVPPPAPGVNPGGYNPAGGNPNAGYNPQQNSGGLTSIPTRSVRTSNYQDQQSHQQLSPEAQMILMEAQRELNKNNPNAPPLPPTPLTPNSNNGGNQNGGGFPTLPPSLPR